MLVPVHNKKLRLNTNPTLYVLRAKIKLFSLLSFPQKKAKLEIIHLSFIYDGYREDGSAGEADIIEVLGGRKSPSWFNKLIGTTRNM